ncbi:MAG: sigma 54-interacting transcriptional regulator [Flavobacteriales bacterium]|nr:sigma 54-interacting transcriptional regulator [Flavobacteriales bacterium]
MAVDHALPMATKSTTTSERKLPSLLIALKMIMEGTAPHTGKPFFRSLVRNLAEVLDVHGVWVTNYIEAEHSFDSIAFWLNGKMVDHFKFHIPGTPCEGVVDRSDIVHIPERLLELYPSDRDLPLPSVSYMGIALRDEDGKLLGHLAMLDDRPMAEIPEVFAIFRIFASRATAELIRARSQKRQEETAAKLERLVDGSMDAILELDAGLRIVHANRAAQQLFEARDEAALLGSPLTQLLEPDSLRKVQRTAANLEAAPGTVSNTFIQGHIRGKSSKGSAFTGEATMCRYALDGRPFLAIYIRNVNERLAQEEKLKELGLETTLLRERIALQDLGGIIGESPGIKRCLEQVMQVGPTQGTVLITGETGTGKELFAKAVHQASPRSDKALVNLNCAALPTELIESELFGHVKGAFTGALTAREGRFSLANGGTIFLDEIGELPLALQAKLLRVLQEGEFEPLGSSRTVKVDVRVIAATNRDLPTEVAAGRFREDLYYRLNVFPIAVPPLRDRGTDVLLIAEAMLDKLAKRHHRARPVLGEMERQQLLNYPWPGNVRELQNVIERALITSTEGTLGLARTLGPTRSANASPAEEQRILTEQELEALQADNIRRALAACKGRVSGRDGAAALLGIPPTTLASRLRKMGIA